MRSVPFRKVRSALQQIPSVRFALRAFQLLSASEQFQVHGALEGLRRRGKGALTVRKIQKMYGDLLRTLAKRLEAGAACRRGLII